MKMQELADRYREARRAVDQANVLVAIEEGAWNQEHPEPRWALDGPEWAAWSEAESAMVTYSRGRHNLPILEEILRDREEALMKRLSIEVSPAVAWRGVDGREIAEMFAQRTFLRVRSRLLDVAVRFAVGR